MAGPAVCDAYGLGDADAQAQLDGGGLAFVLNFTAAVLPILLPGQRYLNMKFGVVIFPGSNCDRDTLHVFQNVLNQEAVPVWHKDNKIPSDIDCIVLPGGFSYGDYLRSGAIARFSPVMQAVVDF